MPNKTYYTVKKRPSVLSHVFNLIKLCSIVCCIWLLIDIFLNPTAYPPYILKILIPVLVCFSFLYLYINQIGSRDKLTGVLLQSAFVKNVLFKQISGKLKSYDTIFINLKGYKYVNQLLGSRAADEVLVKYAKSIQKYLKKDELLARFGGDNFVILLEADRLAAFLNFIEVINIEQEVNGTVQTFPISCYAGVALLTDKVSDALSNSAFALQKIREKKTGNYLIFNEEIANSIINQNRISFLFPTALENGDFKVFYQPKINIKTKKLTGCEALVRWEYPDGTVESPANFIPTLEKTGLITALDYYVFDKVCQDINSWKAKGYTPVPVSVNFSKHHLRNVDFTQKVLEIIHHNNVDKNLIEMELTESENFEDYDSLLTFIKHMQNNGIKTSIDDFGIGYSSLSLLANEDVKIFKIDKSFVDNIADNNGKNIHATLLTDIITSCHNLGKEVICEGIETPEQLAILKDLDCSIIQGFYFDKPLTYLDFENRLRNPVY